MFIVRQGKLTAVVNTKVQKEMKDKGISIDDITLKDTIISCGGEKVLPFKIAIPDTDENGNEKFIFNKETQEFEHSYHYSPIIYAYGRQINRLLQIGPGEGIKVTYREQWIRQKLDQKLYRTAECVQIQDLDRIMEKNNPKIKNHWNEDFKDELIIDNIELEDLEDDDINDDMDMER